MAIFALDKNSIEGVANLGCDVETDIQDLPAYAESNRLKAGSTCLCKETSEAYMMGTNGSWDPI